MTIEWLAGNRLKGTTAERPASTFPNGGSGGWKEVGRTTLSGTSDQINISSLPDKRYYMTLYNTLPSGVIDAYFRLNEDTGSNYASRKSQRGGTDGTNANATEMVLSGGNASQFWGVQYFANLPDKEKLMIAHTFYGNGSSAGTAPDRYETVSKWTNTTDAINSIRVQNFSAGDYASGSECVVLGWDPADTHTDNFWEELASVELSSAGDNLSSGTISAKKYLWVQCWYKNNSASDINVKMRFNNDSGSNYASRYSHNGAADTTRTSKTFIDTQASGGQYPNFVNCFIVNNASKEKLVISQLVGQSTAGAGNAPIRTELVGKWTNTSNQITEIDFDNVDAGDIAAGAILKVWGAD